jgi:enterochelin esterase family protein
MKFPESFDIRSSCGGYARKAWMLRSGHSDSGRVIVFLDAEHYLRDLDCLPVIGELRKMERMTCVFVSHENSAARHADYACSEAYARFIVEDVVEQVGSTKGGHLVCGLSLSGLASAFVCLRYPEVFGGALCQSGSFWWMVQNGGEIPRTNARFWLSVGDEETATWVNHPPSGMRQEISQIEGVRVVADRLRERGGDVNYHEFSGGHKAAPWRAELADALRWLAREETL